MRIRPRHTTHTRDAALSKLARINRLILAGSVTLTGVLADVAAHAFPGRTPHSHSVSTTKPAARQTHSVRAPSSSSGSLHPPAEAPKPAGETKVESAPEQPATTSESPPSSQAAPAQESAGSESKSTPEPAPAQEPTPQPTHEPEPAPAQEEPAPVVSGGS
jgi:hypothetical protein